MKKAVQGFALLMPFVLCSPAVAQSSNELIEEVIVTATKRESSVQDLAVAVTAISGELITDLQMVNVLDLDKVAESMARRHVVDARNIMDRAALLSRGFSYQGIGRN